MIPATPDEQRQLLALARVDAAIHRLEHRRANLPEQKALDENAETLSRIAAEYSAGREQRERLALAQKRHEEEISAIDSRRKSEEGRMYSGLIHSERELEALRGELSSLKTRKRDLEDALLEIMEQLDETESLVATLEERHTELTAEVDQLTAARDAAATDIDAELRERRAERAAVAGELPTELADVYDDVRRRKAGVGVAQLAGRMCDACRLDLTEIELEEFREQSARELARCPQCGRILVAAAPLADA